MKLHDKLFAALTLLAIGLATGTAELQAQDRAATAELSVLLTSCGQSPGPQQVAFFLNRLQLTHQFEEQATAGLLVEKQQAGTPFKSLIIVSGASLKGMGAAGISMRDELARTEALIAEAKRQQIKVICAHVEGMTRRAQGAAAGDTSDEQSIDAVCPHADFMIVREEGNEDGRFDEISRTRRIPLILYERNMDLSDVLTRVFQR